MRCSFAFGLLVVAACGDDAPLLFPANYAETYVEVRGCEPSTDHNLHSVRILASPDAVTPYTDRVSPFAVGAVLVKEEYSRTDADCAGTLREITAMQRVREGSAPALLDWRWQRTDGELQPIEADEASCSRCHARCPGGHAGTCLPP
jgi:hypothetical protein